MLKREFKFNFKGLIIWSAILMALFLLVFCVYPSISSNNAAMEQMLSMFPDEMLKAFNMDIASISTAFGWFQTEGNIFLLLVGSLYSAILGATILIKEENDKTIEYLYSKPVNRNMIVTSKLLCGVINILIFTIAVTLFNYIGLNISGEINHKLFFMISLYPLLVYFAFFALSLMVSNFFVKTKKTMSMAIAFVFVSYFLQTIGNMGDKIKIIKYFSLFELAPSRYIILNNGLNIIRIALGIGLIIIGIVFTYYRYNKKEFA